MAGVVSRRASKSVKAIADELDDGYRHRMAEMLRFMLSEIMVIWGFPAWDPVPEVVRGKITNAISAYDTAVAEGEPFLDLLGPLYQELSSRGGKQQLGQFFTPWNLAKLMAHLTIPPGPQEDTSGRLIATCDPTCGSGVLMLAAASAVLEKEGGAALRQWSFHGCDVDPICARMMAIQFLANCASHRIEVGEVIVFRGDSLNLQAKKELITHASAPGLAVMPANAPGRQKLLADTARGAGVTPVTADSME
ncbi:N-6 DNA methylase [Cupriavidus metallidurans]|uniref:N-6 DNA methylase n=1 Tax=Cupriavidus metallidurans TaxID=119219 RepID=UPI000A3F0F78|nr:N-6 DNA methylase [Cupriavidus metallidurans]